MLSRWKRAVVNLECATDSDEAIAAQKRLHEAMRKRSRNEITHDEFYAISKVTLAGRDLRSQGTALFLKHAGQRFLLTARHVVLDEVGGQRLIARLGGKRHRIHPLALPMIDEVNVEMAADYIFQMIFRVPSIDEASTFGAPAEFLMNLGTGTSETRSFMFSDPELDLAVISLDIENSRFADDLERNGYVPVLSDEIDDGPQKEGCEVFTIGFPEATSQFEKRYLAESEAVWASSAVSLPVSSFGRVSMLHESLAYFWADMSIYPGNSGGPVVQGDRLVGVVSAQATEPIEGASELNVRIPFAMITKGKHVMQLLEMQVAKESEFERWRFRG
jgi:hypothetical protein